MVINEEGARDYGLKLAAKCADVILDMLAKGDYQALYEFGNQVNGLAARRGLPSEEPVALLDLKPEDFAREE